MSARPDAGKLSSDAVTISVRRTTAIKPMNRNGSADNSWVWMTNPKGVYELGDDQQQQDPVEHKHANVNGSSSRWIALRRSFTVPTRRNAAATARNTPTVM